VEPENFERGVEESLFASERRLIISLTLLYNIIPTPLPFRLFGAI
jgi:hypothetical protein